MNVPLSNFVLRERKFWECTDLSILMFRRFIPAIAACFGSFFILICAVVLIVLGPIAPWLPVLVIWWLKPLWERIIIAPAGLLFFNADASPRQIVASLKRIFSPALLSGLTYRRFCFFDSYLLPVDMFEHPDKARRKERRLWLHKGIDGQLFGLSAFFFVLEILFFFSLFYSLVLMASTGTLGFQDEGDILAGYLPASLCCFATLLITEPLYLLSAFALYINRRTLHEGWDLRLAFQKLGRGIGAKSKKTLLLAVILCVSSLHAFHAQAIEASPYETKLKQVIDNRDFGGTEQARELRFKSTPEPEKETKNNAAIPNFMAQFSAIILRFLAIIGGCAIVLFLAIYIARRIGKRQKIPPEPSVSPDLELLSSDRQKRELDLAQGLAAWERSDQRLALACLYQVGISLATKSYGVRLPESATEGTCMAIVGRSKAQADFIELFEGITKAWISVSWSDRHIESELFRQLYDSLRSQEETL